MHVDQLPRDTKAAVSGSGTRTRNRVYALLEHVTAKPAAISVGVTVLLGATILSLNYPRWIQVQEVHPGRKLLRLQFPGSSSAALSPEESDTLFGQIAKEFEPWRASGITKEMVDAAYCCAAQERSFRLQVVDGEIYIAGEVAGWGNFPRLAKQHLVELGSQVRLPDVDVMMTTADRCPETHCEGDCQPLSPVLSQTKKAGESRCIATPDFSFQGWPEPRLPPWSTLVHLMQEPADRLSWAQKAGDLFFRGALTSPTREIVAQDNALMQSRLTDIGIGDWLRDGMKFESLPAHCAHRYLLVLPGAGYAGRSKFLALCKSVIIYPTDGFHEFWTPLLKNGTHIIYADPINPETKGQQLLQIVSALEADLHQGQRIAEAAADLVQRALHPRNMQRYWMELFMMYASLQRFTPTVHADAIRLADSVLGSDSNATFSDRTCRMSCPKRLAQWGFGR